MKIWFPYKYGYVNIDEENVYFTSSGNWQDALALKQLAPIEPKKNTFNQAKPIILVLVYGLFSLTAASNFSGSTPAQVIAFGLAVLSTYFLYRKFRRDTGPQFRIPLEGIEKIEFQDDSATVSFIRYKSWKRERLIEDIGEAGIEGLTELNEHLKKNQGLP